MWCQEKKDVELWCILCGGICFFVGQWTFVLKIISLFYNNMHRDSLPFHLHRSQAVLAPMQGFWNAIVYGWSRKEFRRAVRIHGSERSASSSNYQSLNNSRVDQGNNASPTQWWHGHFLSLKLVCCHFRTRLLFYMMFVTFSYKSERFCC